MEDTEHMLPLVTLWVWCLFSSWEQSKPLLYLCCSCLSSGTCNRKSETIGKLVYFPPTPIHISIPVTQTAGSLCCRKAQFHTDTEKHHIATERKASGRNALHHVPVTMSYTRPTHTIQSTDTHTEGCMYRTWQWGTVLHGEPRLG